MHTKSKTRLMVIWIVLCLVVLSVATTTLIYADAQLSQTVDMGINYSAPSTNADIFSYLTLELGSGGKSYYITDCSTSISGEVIIPKQYNNKPITGIEHNAFYSCSKITSLVIQENITYISPVKAFGYCFSLEKITVKSNNPVYYSEGNCIIERATKTLVLGCSESDFPNDIKIIGMCAFYGCTKWSMGKTLPSSCECIYAYAFCYCTNLECLLFNSDSKLKRIETRAFEGCNKFSFYWLGSNFPSWQINIEDGAGNKTEYTKILRSSYSSQTAYNSAMSTFLTSTYKEYHWDKI